VRCPGDAHGIAQCVGGTCVIACGTGYHLCDGRCVDDTSPATCGSSCTACAAPAGGNATCTGGSCGGSCPPGKKLCNGACIDMAMACAGTCSPGTHNCGGVCAANDSANSCGTSSCATCPVPVGATSASCDGTACGFSCGSGYHRCGDRCASDDDATACGAGCVACPNDPNGQRICTGGTCGLACRTGYHRCGTRCVSNTDPATCGTTACDTPCQKPAGGDVTCTGLACVPSCPDTSKKLCNGACIALAQACDGVCPQGTHNCGGICQPDDSTSYCGAACASCPAPAANGTAVCTGTCGISCASTFRNCPMTSLCIPSTGCCTADDCTAAPPGKVGTCTSGNTCSYACQNGYRPCGEICIPMGSCCGNQECPDSTPVCNANRACDSSAYRLTVTKVGAGTGTVTSTPAGLTCTGITCTGYFPPNTAVTLQARTTNGSSSFFSAWTGGGCSGPVRDCALTLTSSTSVQATFSPMTHNLIFVSSDTVAANLGGVLPYDAHCNQLATTRGINNTSGDAYIAAVSTSTSPFNSRLGAGARGWIRVDSRPVVDQQADFTSGKFFYPARLDENGTDRGDAPLAIRGCLDWTTSQLNGVFDGVEADSNTFADRTIGGCSNPHRIACMRRDLTAALSPTPMAGKRIWVSNTVYVPSASQTPDQKCDSTGEKPAGISRARALITGTIAPVVLVLDLAATYVRVDGTLVGTGSQLRDVAANATMFLESGIWQRANGAYLRNTITLTGGASLTTVGVDGNTCANWTSSSPSANARNGNTDRSGSEFWAGATSGYCNAGAFLYCVEE
jgi:hypothetical protein